MSILTHANRSRKCHPYKCPARTHFLQKAHSRSARARCALGGAKLTAVSSLPTYADEILKDTPPEMELLAPTVPPPMERPLTVLRMSLYHPTQGSAVFATVPQRLQHDTSPLLVGRGLGSHLQLHLPGLSRQHLSLEPYREQGGTLLAFSLKALSRRGYVWVNGLALRFLEQVPLGTVNRVIFAGIQMVVHVEGGTSLEAFVCCFHVSPSPLICRPQAEETDEWEDIPEEPPAPGSEQLVPGHFGFPHDPSQAANSSPQPHTGGGTEIQLQREPVDGRPC